MSARVTEAMVAAAKAWFDENFNGLPDTDTLVRGVLAAALSTEAAPVAWLRRRDIDGPCNAIPAWKTQSDGADVAVYTAPISTEAGEAEEMVLVPKAALDWLNGEGPDDNGYWFGDGHEALGPVGAFWWRKVFNRMKAGRTALEDKP